LKLNILLTALFLFGISGFDPISSQTKAQELPHGDSVQLELVKRIEIARSRRQLLSIIPAGLRPCIGAEVKGGKLWSSVATSRGDYHLIGLFFSDNYYNYSEAIVSVREGNCQILTPLNSQKPFSYLSYLSESIVVPLLVDKYRKEINELGGLDNFKLRHFENFGDPSWEHYLSSERLKAFKQLGIKLPSTANVFVISPQGIFPYLSSESK